MLKLITFVFDASQQRSRSDPNFEHCHSLRGQMPDIPYAPIQHSSSQQRCMATQSPVAYTRAILAASQYDRHAPRKFSTAWYRVEFYWESNVRFGRLFKERLQERRITSRRRVAQPQCCNKGAVHSILQAKRETN